MATRFGGAFGSKRAKLNWFANVRDFIFLPTRKTINFRSTSRRVPSNRFRCAMEARRGLRFGRNCGAHKRPINSRLGRAGGSHARTAAVLRAAPAQIDNAYLNDVAIWQWRMRKFEAEAKYRKQN